MATAGVYGRVYGSATGTNVSSNVATSSTVIRTYPFAVPSLSWVVTHNLNTQNMNVTLFDSNHNIMFAKINAVSNNQFIVSLTAPMSGTVNVTFIV